MPLGDTFQSDILKLIFENINISNLGDATGVRGSSTAGSVYVALHTSSPGGSGTQSTNEASYTGYTRVAIGRSNGNFSITGADPTVISNSSSVTFPTNTGSSQTVTHFSIGFASSGANEIICYAALSSSFVIINGLTPVFPAGLLQVSAI